MSEHPSFIPFFADEPRSVQVEKLKEKEPELKQTLQCLIMAESNAVKVDSVFSSIERRIFPM